MVLPSVSCKTSLNKTIESLLSCRNVVRYHDHPCNVFLQIHIPLPTGIGSLTITLFSFSLSFSVYYLNYCEFSEPETTYGARREICRISTGSVMVVVVVVKS